MSMKHHLSSFPSILILWRTGLLLMAAGTGAAQDRPQVFPFESGRMLQIVNEAIGADANGVLLKPVEVEIDEGKALTITRIQVKAAKSTVFFDGSVLEISLGDLEFELTGKELDEKPMMLSLTIPETRAKGILEPGEKPEIKASADAEFTALTDALILREVYRKQVLGKTVLKAPYHVSLKKGARGSLRLALAITLLDDGEHGKLLISMEDLTSDSSLPLNVRIPDIYQGEASLPLGEGKILLKLPMGIQIPVEESPVGQLKNGAKDKVFEVELW